MVDSVDNWFWGRQGVTYLGILVHLALWHVNYSNNSHVSSIDIPEDWIVLQMRMGFWKYNYTYLCQQFENQAFAALLPITSPVQLFQLPRVNIGEGCLTFT